MRALRPRIIYARGFQHVTRKPITELQSLFGRGGGVWTSRQFGDGEPACAILPNSAHRASSTAQLGLLLLWRKLVSNRITKRSKFLWKNTPQHLIFAQASAPRWGRDGLGRPGAPCNPTTGWWNIVDNNLRVSLIFVGVLYVIFAILL